MPKKIPGVVQRSKRRRELPAELLEMQREFELKYAVKQKMEAAQPMPDQPSKSNQPAYNQSLISNQSVYEQSPMPISLPMMMSLPTVQRQPQTTSKPPMARVLIVLKGKLIGQAHLNKPALTIGCMAGNDIEIPYTGVSRLHAKILAEQGSWVIEDAGSMNGVMYQGERVKRVTLCNRACVYLAPGLALHYEVASSPL